MKFRYPDVIRHKNGVKLYHVVATNRDDGIYVLCEVDTQYLQPVAHNLVDTMYVKAVPVLQNEMKKHVRLATGYGSIPEMLDQIASARGYKPDTGSNAEPVSPPVGPSSDVAVSLPGLPSGYYLKSFRRAMLGELVLNTSGTVVTAKGTGDSGVMLYRPIVGRVSDLHKLYTATPRIPGIPDGWEVIAYRKPNPGDHCIRLGSTEVFTCSSDDVFAPKNSYVIVQKIPRITPCDGTLPGISKGYRLVGFGAVSEKQFFIDTVGSLKPGPAKHRLILEQLPGRPLEVVTEYEYQELGTRFYFWSSTTPSSRNGSNSIRNTGRTRKVVIQ